jgi:transcriptional regulator with XRE-family HTH domain
MTITGAQVSEARRLLGWTRNRLTGESGLSPAIISHLETGRRWATVPRLSSIRCALEDYGVEFVAENGGGPAVRLKKEK